MQRLHEIWKPVSGFPQYEVSNHGRVRSLRWTPPRILKPGRKPSGHVSVCFGRQSGSQDIHVLVLEAFVGPRPPKHDACHNDGDPSNNVLTNLRWDTRANNILDAIESGTWFSERRKEWFARIGTQNREHLIKANRIRWGKYCAKTSPRF